MAGEFVAIQDPLFIPDEVLHGFGLFDRTLFRRFAHPVLRLAYVQQHMAVTNPNHDREIMTNYRIPLCGSRDTFLLSETVPVS